MDRVMAATVFNHICDLGSLSAAARALGLSRPMVSRYLDAYPSLIASLDDHASG